MGEVHKVVAKVISQEGTCGVGHKVGDEWVIGLTTPEGICQAAYSAISPPRPGADAGWGTLLGKRP